MAKRYVDNAMNRRLGRVGMVHGTAVHDKATDSLSYKTYVDNALNQKLGRVGKPRGSEPQSSSPDSSYYDYTYLDYLPSPGKHGIAGHRAESDLRSSSSSSSSDTDVVTSPNRRIAQVGQKHVTAVQPKAGTGVGAPSSSSKTYADNALNRSLGRVGLELGTAAYHRDETRTGISPSVVTQSKTSTVTEPRVYRDNSLNRRLGRAGDQLGSKRYNSHPRTHTHYVDNEYNRRHNRVGKPLGSVPIPRKDRKYIDNTLNRRLDRVGLPWCAFKGNPHAELLRRLKTLNFEDDIPDDVIQIYEKDNAAKEIIEKFLEITERESRIRKWLEESSHAHWDAKHRTSKKAIDPYRGTIINCKELKFIQRIGHGDFGEVHMAEWVGGQLVAVKLLRNKSMSQEYLREFEREIFIICELDHHNVVQFMGACNELPHLTIVMEYMDISLHEALHIKMVDFVENERISIMRDIANGLEYLHKMQIAHCDLKPGNVLLNNIQGEETSDSKFAVKAKLTDFGLSVFKYRTGTTASGAVSDSIIGTPRYSAPEVLRRELLGVDQRKMSDVYSFGLTVVELLLEEMPFEDLRPDQLREHVGKRGMKPMMKNWHILTFEVTTWLDTCWNGNVKERPISQDLASFSRRANKIYAD